MSVMERLNGKWVVFNSSFSTLMVHRALYNIASITIYIHINTLMEETALEGAKLLICSSRRLSFLDKDTWTASVEELEIEVQTV